MVARQLGWPLHVPLRVGAPIRRMRDRQMLELAAQELERRAQYLYRQMFLDTGACARHKYAKHLEFFRAGADNKERLFMAANRVGKSNAGAYEVTAHLTGLYPSWWQGRRFDGPVEVWACGTNSQTTRDIVQAKLLGPVHAPRTGMIQAHLIHSTTPSRHGIAGSIETAMIRHVSGGLSMLGLKTYEQGRASFEGTEKHVVWDDEEPPSDVYTEQLYRTLTTHGITLVTFTPLQGMSDVVRGFMEPSEAGSGSSKWYIQAGWQDVPHLDADEQRTIIATTPPYQVAARTTGEPALGAGAIYPIPESEILVPTRTIPDTWRRVYALDVGWSKTAAIWGAEIPGTQNIELYDEHYQGQGEPASHAAAIRARGERLCGVIDPASLGSSQMDGRTLIEVYRSLGLQLYPAVNAVEAGLIAVWDLLVSGRLKVQEHLHAWRSEFRQYHRDENGKIVKSHDHLMDAMRYLVMSGRTYLTLRMAAKPMWTPPPIRPSRDSWMGS